MGSFHYYLTPCCHQSPSFRLHPRQPNTVIKSANDCFLWVIATNRPIIAADAHPIAASGFSILIVSSDVTKVFVNRNKSSHAGDWDWTEGQRQKRRHVSCVAWKTLASAAPSNQRVHQGHCLHLKTHGDAVTSTIAFANTRSEALTVVSCF